MEIVRPSHRLLIMCRIESGSYIIPDRGGSGDLHRPHCHHGIWLRQCDRDGGETERIGFRGEGWRGDHEIQSVFRATGLLEDEGRHRTSVSVVP